MKKYSIISLSIFSLVLVSCFVPSQTQNLKTFPVDLDKKIGKTPMHIVFDKPSIRAKAVAPIYPDSTKRNGIKGDVWVYAEILYTGNVGAVEIAQSLQPGPEGLDEAAIMCVKQWEYKPATKNGKPIAVCIKFPIRFSLD